MFNDKLFGGAAITSRYWAMINVASTPGEYMHSWDTDPDYWEYEFTYGMFNLKDACLNVLVV